MSNEIQHSLSVSLSNSGLTDSFNPGQIQVTQNSQLMWQQVVDLTAGADTSITALIAGVTTYGICVMYNLDPTNYVQVGPTSGGAIVNMIRLKPKGDIPAVFRLEPGITLRAKANTGNCKVLIKVYND